jgi:hypothetical protein
MLWNNQRYKKKYKNCAERLYLLITNHNTNDSKNFLNDTAYNFH